MFTAAVALLLAMANLFYRDVKYLFEIVISVGMFATSVVYPVDRIGGRLGQLLRAEPDDADHRRLPRGAPARRRCRRPDRSRRGASDFGAPAARRPGCCFTAPSSSSRRTSDHGTARVVFDGVWKKFQRGERHDSLRDLRAGARAPGARPRAPAPELLGERVLGASGTCRSRCSPARRSASSAERRGQIDDAEAADADPAADARPLRDARPRRRADRGRRRLPSRPHRPREHLPAGRDHGHEARARSPASSTRSSSSPGSRSSSTRRSSATPRA